MIRTDGRPTIAMRESEPLIPGQMTVEDCIAQAEADNESCEEKHARTDHNSWGVPEPVYGGF